MPKNIKEWLILLVSIALCQAVGIAGAFFTIDAIPSWYAGLIKPVFAPPNWFFAPVWTLLYILMGISLFLIWHAPSHKRARTLVLALFFLQLLLNALWTPIFFGLKNIPLAFAEIILLIIALGVTIRYAWQVSKVAGWLLVPYFLWIVFAGVLTGAILIGN